MKSIRCGKGLGDSIYLQAVVRHLVQQRGMRLMVGTNWPDVFLPLAGQIETFEFTRERRFDIVAHYVTRKTVQGTTQFQDCCHAAGIAEPVELKLDWRKAEGELVERILAPGLPVVCVALPRYPMGREDGFGLDLLPDCKVIQRAIDGLKGKATIVQIGAGRALHKFDGINFDLANQTSVAELIDVVSVASGCLGYCSFLLPLAESLDKPLLLVWSRKGLKSAHEFIRLVTPAKLLHKPSSMWVMDWCTDEQFEQACKGFHAAIGI